MSDQAEPVSRPWRRYLRFSVRGLILVVLLVGGWLGWIVRSARMQREAVAAITDAGGKVLYDWECRDGMRIPGGRPWVPAWLVDRIGVDYFGHIIGVRFELSLANLLVDTPGSVQAKRLPLTEVGRLTQLEALTFYGAGWDDADLSPLKGLQHLKELELSLFSPSDTQLTSLETLMSLRSLRLSFSSLTDGGLAHLKGLTKLAHVPRYST
jgi:hypothetical protein